MPFEPSGVGVYGEIPGVCWLCGCQASGIGFGKPKWGKGEYKWLCEECVKIAERLEKTAHSKLKVFELEALQGGIDAVGDYIEKKGITDLALMDELDCRLIVKAAWTGSVLKLRELIREFED